MERINVLRRGGAPYMSRARIAAPPPRPWVWSAGHWLTSLPPGASTWAGPSPSRCPSTPAGASPHPPL